MLSVYLVRPTSTQPQNKYRIPVSLNHITRTCFCLCPLPLHPSLTFDLTSNPLNPVQSQNASVLPGLNPIILIDYWIKGEERYLADPPRRGVGKKIHLGRKKCEVLHLDLAKENISIKPGMTILIHFNDGTFLNAI